MTKEAPRLLLAIEDNQGYAPEAITNTITLRDLIEALQSASEDYGEDVLVVLDNCQRYGARYGAIDTYRDLLVLASDEEDDE